MARGYILWRRNWTLVAVLVVCVAAAAYRLRARPRIYHAEAVLQAADRDIAGTTDPRIAVGANGVIRVSAEATDPQSAAQSANALAEDYVEQDALARRRARRGCRPVAGSTSRANRCGSGHAEAAARNQRSDSRRDLKPHPASGDCICHGGVKYPLGRGTKCPGDGRGGFHRQRALPAARTLSPGAHYSARSGRKRSLPD